YVATSNVSLNYHKTQDALSISSATHSKWITGLNESAGGIPAWHDKTTLTPIIYLGYPIICASSAQRISHVNTLIN
ncbi:hypothetical protein FB192DRAFT_1281673, partial [Mucor lusitanicus]